jgi:hypothetical protein
MDYPAVNIAAEREKQTLFYPISPGPYDDWFIEYGYSPGLDDPEAEAERLAAILARSTEPELVFGNDADDMRAVGRGIDPRVNIFDMSSDAIGYADAQIDLMRRTLAGLAEKSPAKGSSWQETLEGVTATLKLWSQAATVVSRYIGGVYVDRAMVGQPGAGEPLRPVEAERQTRAMDVLARQVFAPEAFRMDPALLRRAAPERRGFDHLTMTEDPKIHEAVLNIQKVVLDHLLHPVVMARVADTTLYGNDYTLAAVMEDLTSAVFEGDPDGEVNSVRRGLQLEYTQRLAKMVRPVNDEVSYPPAAVSLAVYSLDRIRKQLEDDESDDAATAAHRAHLHLIIERALSKAV